MAITSDSINLLFKAKGDTDEAKKAFNELATSFGLSEGAAKDLGVALPIIGAAVTAVSAAVVTATVALFELTRSASEFGSEIFDATEKTGLAAETISAMKFAADQSGTSLEAVTAASSKFARVIGDAALGSEKAQAKLDRLGVTSKDLDTALGQALGTIAKLPPGIAQMTAAQDAFGKSGVELLPFIKSFDGDLAALTQRAKDLGVTITDDAARKADAFGDTLDTVSAQAAGLGRAFAFEFMPQITGALQSVSDFMARNKGAAAEWGTYLANTIRGVTAAFEVLGRVADNVFTTITLGFNKTSLGAPIWGIAIRTALDFAFAGLPTIIDNLERIGALMPAAIDSGPLKYSDKATLPGAAPEPYKGVFSKSGMDKRDKWDYEQEEKAREAAKKAAEEARRAREKAEREQTAEAKRQAAEMERQAKEDAQNLLRIERERVEEAKTYANDEIERFESDKAKMYAVAAQYADKNKLTEADLARFKEELERQSLEFRKAKLAEYYQELLKGEGHEKEIARVQQDQYVLENTIEQKRAEHAKNEADRQKKALDDVKKYNEEQRKFWADEIKASEARAAALTKAWNDQVEREDKERAKKAQDARDAFNNPSGAGGSFIGSALGALGTSVEEATKPVNKMQQLGQMLGATFGQVANAVGNAVRSFVLFGSAGGSFRKFAAEVIASIAQMSVVQAIFEAAQGLAMLALTWFTGNPKYAASAGAHFASAAAFGIIGGVATIAGRATAGNSFSQASSGNFGTASSGGNRSGNGGSVYSSQEDGVVETSRNNPGGMGVLGKLRSEITLKIESTSAHIVQVVKDNINNNGQLRTVIQDAT